MTLSPNIKRPCIGVLAALLLVFACGDDDADIDAAADVVVSDVPADVASDVPADVPADVPTDAPADAPADAVTDVGNDSGGEDTGIDAGDCVPAGGSYAVVPGAPSCCPGLMSVGCGEPDSAGACAPCAGASFCTDCGNGTCDDGENVCRCPADCT